MRGKGNITRAEMQRRMNERKGLGFFGSAGAFLGMVVLAAVLLVSSIDMGAWLDYMAEQDSIDQVISGLIGQTDPDSDDSQSSAPSDQDDDSDNSQDVSQSSQSADTGDSQDESQSSQSADSGDNDASSASSASQDDESDSAKASPSLDLAGYYYYDQLNSSDQEKYEQMYRVMALHEEVEFPGTNEGEIERFRNYVDADHPEIFYTHGYKYSTDDKRGVTVLSDASFYSKDQIDQYKPQIDKAVKQIEAGIPVNADDYTKARVVYEYLVQNIAYDHSLEEQTARDAAPPEKSGQTVVNALLEHSCVCNGYAQAFELVMHDLGIPCVLVTGDLNDGRGAHGWNLAKLDGEWYYVDPTWGDPDANDNYVPGESSEAIEYAYLAATTTDMLGSRSFDDWQILPDCTATADNFYVKAGRELRAADTNQIIAWGDEVLSRGEREFSFQCSDQQVFGEVLQAIENGAINFAGSPGYYYTYHDDVRTYLFTIG